MCFAKAWRGQEPRSRGEAARRKATSRDAQQRKRPDRRCYVPRYGIDLRRTEWRSMAAERNCIDARSSAEELRRQAMRWNCMEKRRVAKARPRWATTGNGNAWRGAAGNAPHGNGKELRRDDWQRQSWERNCSAQQRQGYETIRKAKELQCREWERAGKQKNKEEKQ